MMLCALPGRRCHSETGRICLPAGPARTPCPHRTSHSSRMCSRGRRWPTGWRQHRAAARMRPEDWPGLSNASRLRSMPAAQRHALIARVDRLTKRVWSDSSCFRFAGEVTNALDNGRLPIGKAGAASLGAAELAGRSDRCGVQLRDGLHSPGLCLLIPALLHAGSGSSWLPWAVHESDR